MSGLPRHPFRTCSSPQRKALVNAYAIALDPNPLAGDEGSRLVVESCVKHERMICVSKRLLPSSAAPSPVWNDNSLITIQKDGGDPKQLSSLKTHSILLLRRARLDVRYLRKRGSGKRERVKMMFWVSCQQPFPKPATEGLPVIRPHLGANFSEAIYGHSFGRAHSRAVFGAGQPRLDYKFAPK